MPAAGSAVVNIQFDSQSTINLGVQYDSLRGTWDDGSGQKSVSSSVTLTVLDRPRNLTSTGSRLQFTGDTNEVHFTTPAGSTPAPKLVTVINTGSAPVRVAPSIGPGGAWLIVEGLDERPIQPLATRTFTLKVDRTKRATADGAPPVTTNLTLISVDADPASVSDNTILQVFDEEPPSPGLGTNRPPLASGEASIIFGSSVSTV
ncbi:MAG: hypothetical protein ABIQ65_16715, partial [Thermoanaerobaculia bacterium]